MKLKESDEVNVRDETKKVIDEKKYKRGKKKERVETLLRLEATPNNIEDEEFTGSEWRVRIIDSGVSLNNHDYPIEVLHEAKELFEGVPVHAAVGPDHSEFERGVKSLAGFIKDVEAVPEGLDGTLHISDIGLKGTLLDLHNEGRLDSLMGLSVVVDGMWIRDGTTDIAEELTEAQSVDLVRSAAAGGKFLEVTESETSEMSEKGTGEEQMTLEMTKEELKDIVAEASKSAVTSFIEAKEKSEAEEKDSKEEEEDKTEGENESPQATSESVEKKTEESNSSPTSTPDPVSAEMSTFLLNAALTEAKLPESAELRIREAFENKPFASKKVRKAIESEKDYLASHQETVVENLTKERRLIVTVDAGDKMLGRIDAMFTPEGKMMVGETEVKAFGGFKEAYATWYGLNPYEVDQYEVVQAFMGGLSRYDAANRKGREKLYTEAPLQQSDLGEVTADRMHKAMIFNYHDFPQYQDWRKVSRILSVADYQAHRQIKFGGYANLAVVAERGVYNDLTHPGDEETTVTMQKRGGIASQITRELIINDNVGAIAEIPRELALAAARTLYQAVFDIFSTNDTYGIDSTGLFHSDHSNTGTTALSISGIDVAQLAMRSQTRALSSSDILGASNLPKILMVPNELQGLAERIVNPSSGYYGRATADTETMDDPYRFKGQLETIVVDYWTDATEYFLAASPQMVAGIGVAFLNGNQEPELFVQSDERVGEVFTQDVQNIKIRHEWREVIMDYRPFYRQT